MGESRWKTLFWALVPLSIFTALFAWVHKGDLNWPLVTTAWVVVIGCNLKPPSEDMRPPDRAFLYPFAVGVAATGYGAFMQAAWTILAGAVTTTFFLASMYRKPIGPRDNSRLPPR